MKNDKYDIFVCPYCKSKLKPKKRALECNCGKRFPIKNNILIFSGENTMKIFYENRYGSGYENGYVNENDRVKLGNYLKMVLEKYQHRIKTSLDVGCNPAMTRIMAKMTGSRTIGLSITSKGMYSEGEWAICDVETGLPFADNSFDFVFSGELVEHTFNTDYFISEIRRVMKEGAYLILTTPNLASFWNRIFIILGYQPHQLGVSMRKSYGNPFLKWDRFWGHTKVFTYKAMKEFLLDNGLEIVKIYGEFIRNEHDGKFKRALRNFMSKFPSLSEDLVCICRKTENR